MIKLAPLPGWHETTRTEGKFMLEGKPYRFSLRTRYLRDLSLNDLEADNQRLLLAELAGGTRDSALAVQALHANASMLTMRTASGSKRIAEWRIPASGTSHSTPAVFLYIWPESDAADAGKDAHFMRWLDARPQHNTPLMHIAFVRPSAMQAKPAPVAEESKLVYRMRLNYWGKEDAGNRHYIIRREGRQIDEGRSDAGGFTRAYNADYDETWGTDVLNK